MKMLHMNTRINRPKPKRKVRVQMVKTCAGFSVLVHHRAESVFLIRTHREFIIDYIHLQDSELIKHAQKTFIPHRRGMHKATPPHPKKKKQLFWLNALLHVSPDPIYFIQCKQLTERKRNIVHVTQIHWANSWLCPSRSPVTRLIFIDLVNQEIQDRIKEDMFRISGLNS